MKYPLIRSSVAFRGVALAVFVLSSTLGFGQVTVGDNLQMTMNGSLGVAYAGGYGNFGRSSHGLGFGVDGLLNGFYFNPKFINFDVRPYFNRSQANADFQSIGRETGVGTSVNFFSTSRFPGSVTFGRDYAMNSEYQFAGVPSVATDVSSQALGVTWSVLIPRKPTLTATYGIGNSDGTITGTSMNTTSSNRNLSIGSTYVWDGWNMSGNIAHYNTSYTTPEILTGIAEDRSSSGTFYSFNTQHSIPIDGSVSFGWAHATGDNSFGDHSSGSSYSVGAGITPWGRLGLSSSFSYSTNASQSLAFSALGTGSTGTPLYKYNAQLMFLSNSASIYIGHGFSVIGHMTWRQEDFGYATYSDTQYGGTLAYRYNHRWLGMLYLAAGLVDTASKTGNGGAGLNATVGLDHRFRGWDVSADFNYLHDLQTIYTIVNTSYLNYGGSLRRKVNPHTYLSLFTRETHSGLVYQSGSGNSSTSFGGSLSWKGYGVTANYSSAKGTAVLSSTGVLVSTPTGPLFTPDFVYFNARALGFSGNKVFFRRLSVSAAYTKVESSSERLAITNSNSGNRFGVNLSYHFRQLNFQGGFSRVNQQFSVFPTSTVYQPRVVDSYFVSVSRWFHVF